MISNLVFTFSYTCGLYVFQTLHLSFVELFILIYILQQYMVVTISLGGSVADQIRYNLESEGKGFFYLMMDGMKPLVVDKRPFY